jgi:hypothetical protein
MNEDKAYTRSLVFLMLLFCAAGYCAAQKTATPGNIGDYKVFNANVFINSTQDAVPSGVEENFDSLVKIGAPQNFGIALSGPSFELPLSMKIFKTGGRVDRITFDSIEIEGIKVLVEDLTKPFKFSQGVETSLPRPLKVRLVLGDNLKALSKLNPAKDEFHVTGRTLVFGTFKKFGMKFKRVIPVEFSLDVKFALSQLLN